MERLTGVFFSSILSRKIYDEFGDCIGKLKDVYVTTEEGYPRAIGYKVKKDGETFNYEFRNIEFIKEDNGKIEIHVRGVKDIIPRTYSYLLSKHLLDKEIVDINGKKVVRVNDLRLAEIAGEIRVVAVEKGILAWGRRYGIDGLLKTILKIRKKNVTNSLIMWDDVESLEMVNDNLKIQVPYQKLSTLHPADLADILEEIDSKYRKKIFESLDENLAADTLEEIEPEVQASLIQDLDKDKTAEVLDNMPNDEIADMLEEMDREEAEEILIHLEKEDADEIRELMAYKEETVGSIMNKDFIAFNIDITIDETVELLREIKPDDEVMYYIYIIDDKGKLQGVVSIRDLVMYEGHVKLKEVMETNIIKVNVEDEIVEAIETMTKYDLISMPVVDNEDKLCGIVIIHDIVDEFLLPTWKKKFKKVS